MRLAPVTGTPFKFQCLHCGQWKTSNEKTLADLNGEAFKAYYCGECLPVSNNPDSPRSGTFPYNETEL